jgi:hypothetical protein
LASNAKKKTTFAKLNRENALRERRLRKEARRDARKQAAAEAPAQPIGEVAPEPEQPATPPAPDA